MSTWDLVNVKNQFFYYEILYLKQDWFLNVNDMFSDLKGMLVSIKARGNVFLLIRSSDITSRDIQYSTQNFSVWEMSINLRNRL